MKGVSYITDENNQKTAVVIDIKTIQKYNDEMELLQKVEKMNKKHHCLLL